MRRNYNGLFSYKHTDKEVLVYFPTPRSALRGVSPKSKGKSGLGLDRRGRSPGPFFVGMRLIPPMCGSKLTDGGPRSLSCNQ
jgi:hypothetical protein